jgi:GT2 family glycosyltransferase
MATAGEHARVVVVDDASSDGALAAALDDLRATGNITLLRNESNLGFVRSVNRVLAMNSGQDVVLLNSDTLVFEDWLRRLSAAAYSDPRVGSATPFSNDGSIASYPRRFGCAIDADEAAALDKLAARTNAGISAEIPVGVGFCLYIRHDCLQDVGELDSAAFGSGYGEESDFCLRARARGWSHRIAADVFVYHAGGVSFGPRRAALLARSQRLLNLRHPGYDRYIRQFLTQDHLLALRRKLDERRLAAFEGRFVLIVTLALEGGVERFVTERKQKIRAEGLFSLVLKPLRPGEKRGCELSTEAIDAPNLLYTLPADFEGLTAFLTELPLARVEIQHFLDHDPAVIDAVRSLGVPYDVTIHDYAWICPRITLIDGSGRYCGEPEASVCESCVRRHGSRLPDSLSVLALRARSEVWLEQARAVFAPSSDAAARLQRYFPKLNIVVSPNTPLIKACPPALPRLHGASRAHRLRVGLIGAIGGHKGYRVLLECARDAAARRLPLQFVVIGYTENDRTLLRTGKVDVTGRYVEAEVAHLLRREQPDVVFLPSVWPETWCYALDHVLSAGLPAVAFDIGAIAERLRAVGARTLLPLDLDAARINERLLEIGKVGYRNLTSGTIPMKLPDNELQHDDGLSASLQVLPLLPGLYLFSVKSATPAADRARGSLRLPAMHVGLGPGVSSTHVEFVAGPSTEGAWLFARGDVLVAKINGPGATLILTSVRAPNGEVLSIEVERLESRSQTTRPPVAGGMSANGPVVAAREPDAQAPVALLANPVSNPKDEEGFVPLQIKTHIRSRGDMNFADAAWAGRVAPGLWLESFSVQPLRNLNARDVEYKGLTGTGFETPWLSDDQNCGTKGMSVPLVGFAVRLRPSAETALYDCEYSGYFQSGTVIGPLRNGAPCRSTVANDPLEGLQIRFVKRANAPASVVSKVRESAKALKRPKLDGGAGKAAPALRSAPRP